jgi:hypothetical protein
MRVPPSKIGGTLVFSQITTNYTTLCPTELFSSIYLYSGGHKQLSFGGGEKLVDVAGFLTPMENITKRYTCFEEVSF